MGLFSTAASSGPLLGRCLNPKMHYPTFPHLGFGTMRHRNKVVRFWRHCKVDVTAYVQANTCIALLFPNFGG